MGPEGGPAPGSDGTRFGFFTDSSICIGCKACEVACKEWNEVPDHTLDFHRYLLRQHGEPGGQTPGATWPSWSSRRHHPAPEFGTIVVQDDICNGCGYGVTARPFGVIERRESDGGPGSAPCATTACAGPRSRPAPRRVPPTRSSSATLDELRARAGERLKEVVAAGETRAQLYGHDEDDGVGGTGALFLLLDDPEVYRLPPDPLTPTRHLARMWVMAGAAAGALAAVLAGSLAGGWWWWWWWWW